MTASAFRDFPAFLLCLVLAAGLQVSTASAQGRVEITVYDEGTPVEGAEVKVTGYSVSGSSSDSTRADGRAVPDMDHFGLSFGSGNTFRINVSAKGKSTELTIEFDRKGGLVARKVDLALNDTGDNALDAAVVARMVKKADDAATDCDATAYEKAIAAFANLTATIEERLPWLEQTIGSWRKSHPDWPDDVDRLDEQVQALKKLEKENSEEFQHFKARFQGEIYELEGLVSLMRARDRLNAARQAVADGRKSVKQRAPDCPRDNPDRDVCRPDDKSAATPGPPDKPAQAPRQARDISAPAIALVHDLASPEALATGGGTASGEAQRAADALRNARLLTPTRIATAASSGMLKAWGDALMMGNRASEFAPEIAAVRDAVVSGDAGARKAAIDALYRKAGRDTPDAKAGKALDEQLDKALGGEPEASDRETITDGDRTIEVNRERRAGKASVEVTQNGADGKPVRTVFSGEERTRPTADKRELETTIVPTGVCSMNEQQAVAALKKISRTWKSGDGRTWKIAGACGKVTVEEIRANGKTLVYAGTYKLGKIVAFHAFTSADDMEELPGDVRMQLVHWTPAAGYTVRFDACAGTESLKGTWSSQHVTYSSQSHQIQTVHDPFDLRLTLK